MRHMFLDFRFNWIEIRFVYFFQFRSIFLYHKKMIWFLFESLIAIFFFRSNQNVSNSFRIFGYKKIIISAYTFDWVLKVCILVTLWSDPKPYLIIIYHRTKVIEHFNFLFRTILILHFGYSFYVSYWSCSILWILIYWLNSSSNLIRSI